MKYLKSTQTAQTVQTVHTDTAHKNAVYKYKQYIWYIQEVKTTPSVHTNST